MPAIGRGQQLMINRVYFNVKPFPADKPVEYIVTAETYFIQNDESDSALIAVFKTKYAADLFAAAMNHSMDLADGHPRR
jgi:hypothetical protein